MATKPAVIPVPEPVKYGSKEHEALVSAAYGMTADEAKQVIKERDENPLTHPYEEYKAAKAMLAALKTKPVPVSTDPGWERDRSNVGLGY